MAQHDYNLSNNTGVLFRADINAALQAIVTQNSGANPPPVTFPGMIWLDLSAGVDGAYRRRSVDNGRWLNDLGQDQNARDAAAAAQATANAAMPRTGGTFTGPIELPNVEPTGDQAVSRAQSDLLYQVVLPVSQAGSLLAGTASGWDAVLSPGPNASLLVMSGGVPTWAQGAVTVQPNSYVRTRADGTIDASLIPSVATGLSFRGVFTPTVSAEYPTTGGSGTGGAPAIGDFWSIASVATAGYTYLTGALTGVTVYNGDNIAKSDGAEWDKLGAGVVLAGYLKADGTTAMTDDFNLGTHQLVEVGGIAARAGPPIALTNFRLDPSNVVVSPHRGMTGADLAGMEAGQLGSDLGRQQLYVGTGTDNIALLAARNFSAVSDYPVNSYVYEPDTGRLHRAVEAITAGAFTASQWRPIIDAGGGQFVGPVAIATLQPIDWLIPDNPAGNIGFKMRVDASDNLVISAKDPGSTTAYVDALTVEANAIVSVRNLVATRCYAIEADLESARFGLAALAGWRLWTDAGTTYLDAVRPSGLFATGRIRASDYVMQMGTGGRHLWRRADGTPPTYADLAELNDAGSLWLAGAITATNIPSCDRRLKTNIADAVPRALDAMQWHAFDIIDGARNQRGIIAQEVLELAPEHVVEYGTRFGDEMVTRYTVNYGSLALEVALNALHRVAALEAAQTAAAAME